MRYTIGIILLTLMISCGSNDTTDSIETNNTPLPVEVKVDDITVQESNDLKEEPTISPDYIGVYHGVQESYNMKNQFGDDMIINGNKVEVPSIDYKFKIEENNVIKLQQFSLDEPDRHIIYEGNYKVIDENEEIVSIECKVSVATETIPSTPSFILKITKSDSTMECHPKRKGEPSFSLSKTE